MTFEEVCEKLEKEGFRLSTLYENIRNNVATQWGAAVAVGRYNTEFSREYGYAFAATATEAVLKALENCKLAIDDPNSPHKQQMRSLSGEGKKKKGEVDGKSLEDKLANLGMNLK